MAIEMVAFFKAVSNNVVAEINTIFSYCVSHENNPGSLQQRIRNRFDRLVRGRSWQVLVGRGIRPGNGTLERCVVSSSHLPTIHYLVDACGIEPTENHVDSSIMGGQHMANRYLRARLNHNAEMNRNNTKALKG